MSYYEGPGCLETISCGVLFVVLVVFMVRAAVKDEKRRDEEKAKILHAEVEETGGLQYADFDGHRYVIYSSDRHGGVCHSPTCQCMNKEKP